MQTLAWCFMDFQAKAVARAVEEALHAAIFFAGLVAFGFKEFFHRVMDGVCLYTGSHLLERQFLGSEYSVIQLPGSFAGTTTNNRACDVAEVAGPLGAGEDVEDN